MISYDEVKQALLDLKKISGLEDLEELVDYFIEDYKNAYNDVNDEDAVKVLYLTSMHIFELIGIPEMKPEEKLPAKDRVLFNLATTFALVAAKLAGVEDTKED